MVENRETATLCCTVPGWFACVLYRRSLWQQPRWTLGWWTGWVHNPFLMEKIKVQNAADNNRLQQQRQTVPSQVQQTYHAHKLLLGWQCSSVFSQVLLPQISGDLACGTTVTQVIHNVNGFSMDNNFIVPTASILHSTKEALSVFVTLHGMCESNTMMGSCFCECHTFTWNGGYCTWLLPGALQWYVSVPWGNRERWISLHQTQAVVNVQRTWRRYVKHIVDW